MNVGNKDTVIKKQHLNLEDKSKISLDPPVLIKKFNESSKSKNISTSNVDDVRKKRDNLKNTLLLKQQFNAKNNSKHSNHISIDNFLDNNHSKNSTPSSNGSEPLSNKRHKKSDSEADTSNNKGKNYPFLFPDFQFVYEVLKNNPDLKEKVNEVVITGFESYLVETWVLERELTNTLSAYSGNPNSIIKCCQIYLPIQPNLWPCPDLKRYYKIMTKLGYLKHINGKGFIFVADIHNLNLNHYQITNLLLISNGGTIKEVWNNFTLNLNLRELQCAGRTSSMFQAPSSASMEKFYQIFKIPKKSLGAQLYDYYLNNTYDPNLPTTFLFSNKSTQKSPFLLIYTDVELLVYMVQTSLMFFNLLDKDCCDGLLCKKTQRALIKWQKTYGAVYFPQLNQSLKTSITFNRINTNLLTALLSLVLVSFFKLQTLDCIPLSNALYHQTDPFMDPSLMFKGIVQFQKKLESKKMKLDHSKTQFYENDEHYIEFLDFIIIDKLFALTDDTDQTEFTQLKRFIKSTVKDLNVTKNGIGKIVSNVGTSTALASLSSNSMITNSIDEFVLKIQNQKSMFKNSETLLATTAISSEKFSNKGLSDQQIANIKLQLHQEKLESKKNDRVDSIKQSEDSSVSGSTTPSNKASGKLYSLKDNLLSTTTSVDNSMSVSTSSANSLSKWKSHSKDTKEADLRKKTPLINHQKNSKVKFPGQISCLIGYMWVEISFPVQTYFSRSKNKEYDYAFYNDFVWYKYNEHFDIQLQVTFKKENTRLVNDIIMFRNEKRGNTPGVNKYSDDESIDDIVERFRIHQFYSSFNLEIENDLDEISKELYDYYNYKYVQKMEDMNGKIIETSNNNTNNDINQSQKNNKNGKMNPYSDLPVDDTLIDINSKAHKEIYQKVQEGILQAKLEDFVKKELHSPEFNNEINRRNSISDMKNLENNVEKPILIRSDSFSTVEDSVFEVNPIIHLNKMAYMIRRDVAKMDSMDIYTSNEIDDEVASILKELNENKIPQFEKNFELIKTTLFQQLQTNNTQIEKQKKQLDSTVSKYIYDTRLLERKFKNCIDTQESFEAKLESLKKKLILEAKGKGIQYLLQLFKDDAITVDDIKSAYNNNKLIANELDKIIIKLEDKNDPKSIITVLSSSKLRIFYKGVNQGVVVYVLKLLLRIFQYFFHSLKKLQASKYEEDEEQNDSEDIDDE